MDVKLERLAEPFRAEEINWKPQTITRDGNRALAVAYIDARDVAERLDQVVGQDRWQVDHKDIGGETLTGIGILTDHGWVWKYDMGMVAQDGGEEGKAKAAKGALSDGLKRAAVLWGIGRYLYRLPKTWVGYDSKTKRLTETPALPKWALPAGAAQKPPAPTQPEPEAAAEEKPAGSAPEPAAEKKPAPAAQKNGNGKVTSTAYWTMANAMIERKTIRREEALRIMEECGNDPAKAIEKLRAFQGPPG